MYQDTIMADSVGVGDVYFEKSDLRGLQSLATQIMGQPFLFFRVAYGEELRLHLGEPRRYGNPRMRGQSRGSYILGARASSWIMTSAPKSAFLVSRGVKFDDPESAPGTPLNIDGIEDGGYITPGSFVIDVKCAKSPPGFVLKLGFSDGSQFMILPLPETFRRAEDREPPEAAAQHSEISDWELLTPYKRVLRVGPGGQWCYVASDTKRA